MMNNTMNHKGYIARIDFDPRDQIFVGRVLGLADNISFHGTTVAELTADFYAAIGNYLDDCSASGRRPEKPASGKMLLRVSLEVHAAAAIAAEAAGKSLNQWAAEALERAANG